MEISGDFLVLFTLDIARAFDLCIFVQVLSEAIKRGIDPSVVKCLCYMYSHLKAKIKGSLFFSMYLRVSDRGGLTSPALFNNSVSAVQYSVKCRFI